jgi:hypothetical protein
MEPHWITDARPVGLRPIFWGLLWNCIVWKREWILPHLRVCARRHEGSGARRDVEIVENLGLFAQQEIPGWAAACTYDTKLLLQFQSH